MTPAELVMLCMMLLIFVRDIGEQYQLHKERWFITTLLLLLATVIVGLFGTLKGIW